MSHAEFSITPLDDLIDVQRISRIEGLAAGEKVTVTSSTPRSQQRTWHSLHRKNHRWAVQCTGIAS